MTSDDRFLLLLGQPTARAHPAEEARRVLRAHWDGSLPVNPGKIAESMGLTLHPLPPRYVSEGVSGYFSRQDRAIFYNPDDVPVRRRFTVAHEIGHFALGHESAPRDTRASFGASNKDPIERAANQFAAELLMPEEAVRKVTLSGRFGSVDEVADAFKVSSVAMNYRLTNLRLSVW
jgi:Zn-dependent peptidase ImmA (M78 family)